MITYLLIAGQVLLLVLIWSTFCNKFGTGVFGTITHESVIMVCFLNVALYLAMTFVCWFVARLPFLADVHESIQEKDQLGMPVMTKGTERGSGNRVIVGLKRGLQTMKFDKKQTAAICFCGAAKGKAFHPSCWHGN